MKARLPREMLAAVTRGLSVSVGLNVIVEALNYASEQLAGYYAWPWFMSETTWTFRAPVTGTCTVSNGTITVVTSSDASFYTYVTKLWRIAIGQFDYPVSAVAAGQVTLDTTKTKALDVATAANFTLFEAGMPMPADFMPGHDLTCYNTGQRYRVRHIGRSGFERHWQAYKGMASNMPLVYADREPYYDTNAAAWVSALQFCPRLSVGTQVRISYQRSPVALDFATNAPSEWPKGYDEVLELLALGRLGELYSDSQAVIAGKRAKGLIRQLRGIVATAVRDDTPDQHTPYGGASWESDGLSVLPREV